MTDPAPIPVYQLFGETLRLPDVAHCERIRDRARAHDWSIAAHRHDGMAQALFLEQGSARVQIDGAEQALAEGDFVYLPVRVVHGFTFGRGTEGLVMSFPLPLLAPLVAATPAMGRALARPVTAPAPVTLWRLMEGFAEALGRRGAFREPAVTALAQAILCGIAEAAASADERMAEGPARLLDRFDGLITRHLAEAWPVARYAALLGVSAGHLSRACRAATGTGARGYLDSALRTEACRLLAFTRLPVSEVGYRLGFEDPSHFSRRFRTLAGVTPGAYRRRLGGAEL